jgi:hypothetical protein
LTLVILGGSLAERRASVNRLRRIVIDAGSLFDHVGFLGDLGGIDT